MFVDSVNHALMRKHRGQGLCPAPALARSIGTGLSGKGTPASFEKSVQAANVTRFRCGFFPSASHNENARARKSQSRNRVKGKVKTYISSCSDTRCCESLRMSASQPDSIGSYKPFHDCEEPFG